MMGNSGGRHLPWSYSESQIMPWAVALPDSDIGYIEPFDILNRINTNYTRDFDHSSYNTVSYGIIHPHIICLPFRPSPSPNDMPDNVWACFRCGGCFGSGGHHSVVSI